jgi:hypothetical protein
MRGYTYPLPRPTNSRIKKLDEVRASEGNMEEQLDLVKESKKMSESKRTRAPSINIHHVFRFYAENEGEFYAVLAAMCKHYNYNFKPQQVKNVYARANKELAKRGLAALTFAPARNNEKYVESAIAEWVNKGVLKKAQSAASTSKK